MHHRATPLRNGRSALARRRREKPTRALTLIELLVVLGIILLLVGIVLSVGSGLAESAERRETETTLEILDRAVDEWEDLTDRRLTWWQFGDANPEHREIHADTPEVLIVNEVFDIVGRSGRVREILASIDSEFIHVYRQGEYPPWIDTPAEEAAIDGRFDGSRTFLDAWGTPIYAIHPGRVWGRGSTDGGLLPRDADGTIRTYNEEKYGVAPARQVVFVSAGPDRKFGLDEEFGDLFGEERERAKREARQDNIYSMDVAFPEYTEDESGPYG